MATDKNFAHGPDWYCNQCDRRKNVHDTNFNGICSVCYFGNYLEKIHPDIFKFSQMFLLDVNIEDYSSDIINDNYMLLRIDDKIRNVLSDFWFVFKFDFDADERFISKGKYILLKNFDTDSPFSGRSLAYLNNRFGKSLYPSNMVLAVIDLVYRDWSSLYVKEGDTLNITLDDFRDCITISKYTKPSINDIDVEFIFEKIKNTANMHLFRGVSKVYDENDGIASSIYRNNKRKIAKEKLQEYEKGVADKLLRQRYLGISTNVDALTELRHLGRDTSFIDFTEDPMIALFFACQKIDTEAKGEIIYFDPAILKKKEDVQYPVMEDFVIYPSRGYISEKRVMAQKSVFVYAHQGYLSRDRYQEKFQHLLIHASLKDLLLKECDYRDSDIYPDLLGFCDNLKNFEIPTDLLTHHEKVKVYFKSMLSAENSKYKTLCFLNVKIENYISDIIKEDYMLLRIDNKICEIVQELFPHKFGSVDFNRVVTMSKYILATNINHERKKYLYDNFDKAIWLFLDFSSFDYDKRTHATTIDITLKEIENIAGIRNQEKI